MLLINMIGDYLQVNGLKTVVCIRIGISEIKTFRLSTHNTYFVEESNLDVLPEQSQVPFQISSLVSYQVLLGSFPIPYYYKSWFCYS